MDINRCTFPSDLLYDLDNLTWIKLSNTSDYVTIGVTTIISYLCGKVNKVRIKEIGQHIEKGKSIASIESLKHFGTVRIPFSGQVIEKNNLLISNPKIINDFPYSKGWIAKLKVDEPSKLIENSHLFLIDSVKDNINEIISKLGIRCFKVFPDHELLEIGVECSATLIKLGELLESIKQDEVVHLVSDDPTADIELTRWTEENKQELVETRKENNLFHFIVKKKK